ncbi:hypothetical protein FA95DRAFT_1506665 [Auriscalpium vulgare]|uniref:Uncharacterized protein n=1 Tax=Auriscalpium vulgare TaxID=40419 RepID=A0ACB8R1B4_9AGAM|nr:hypothetical protein FA95DRAFT_1506665 [Auriscalpium vulgare]
MKANASTAIANHRVVLVPYRWEHVATYHAWMQDPLLREATASEELTLEEEYAMQRSWRDDEDKLTFIVLARPIGDSDYPQGELTDEAIRALPMVGDVNLFLKNDRDDPEFEIEVEVMIADPAYRRQQLAHSALSLLLSYATSEPASPLPVPASRLVVRISASNSPSIALFEKLGFEIVRRVEVFDEVEMRVQQRVEWEGGLVREYR